MRSAECGMRSEITSLACPEYFVSLLLRNPFVERVVAHHNWCRAAARKALNEFDGELAVLGSLSAVGVRVQAELPAEVLVELVRAAEGATQGSAHLYVILPHRLRPEHRVEGH